MKHTVALKQSDFENTAPINKLLHIHHEFQEATKIRYINKTYKSR